MVNQSIQQQKNERKTALERRKLIPNVPFVKFDKEDINFSIVHRFEHQVRKHSNKLAIKFKESMLTYEELNKNANRVARVITKINEISCKKEAENKVALLFQHGFDMVVGILGTLKSGSAYVPLDTDYPIERLIYIINDSCTNVIITNNQNKTLAEKLQQATEKFLKVINIDQIDTRTPSNNLGRNIKSEETAYILYTSGSTGKPKGVIQNHRNLLHFIRVYTNGLHINSLDKLTLLSTYCFDASIMDIFGALLNGASLHIYDIRNDHGIVSLCRWLILNEITIYHSTPTVFRFLMNNVVENVVFPTIRCLVMGGEAVFKRDVDLYKKYFEDNCIFINGLGPTESTVTLQYFIDKKTEIKRNEVPVGYPVENTHVYIINEKGKESAVNELGEIVYKSEYLALGYLNMPQKTAEVFKNDPINYEGRVYFSGDRGMVLSDGSICFLGRNDFQVKIRGYRIDINEIESILDRVKYIEKSVVVSIKNDNDENYLVAYYVSTDGKKRKSEEIRRVLMNELPTFMIPAFIIHMDRMPMTLNGKINRGVLKSLEKTPDEKVGHSAPKDEVEALLLDKWNEVLDTNTKGMNSKFIECGGQSLKAMLLYYKIEISFRVHIPIGKFLDNPTVRDLSNYIKVAEKSSNKPIRKATESEYYPVTPAQKRMYIITQIEKDSMAYNIPIVLKVEGKLEIERLKKSIEQIIRRHEILRTSFSFKDGEVAQKVCNHFKLKFHYQENLNGDLKKVIRKLKQPANINEIPAIGVKVVKISEIEYVIFLNIHHIFSDGESNRLIVRDIIDIYSGKTLPELKVQYKDFAVWYKSVLETEELKRQEMYWLQVMSGELPVLNLPTDYIRPPLQNFEGSTVNLIIKENLYKKLKDLSLVTETTVNMILLSIYNILLAKYTGQEDFIVGIPASGRKHHDLEGLIGVFVNTLGIRNKPQGELSFINFLKSVKKNVIRSIENQDYPFEELLDKLRLKRDFSRNPLFDTMFIMQDTVIEETRIENLKFIPLKPEMCSSKFDITLQANDVNDSIELEFEYCSKLFKKTTIMRMADHFLNIVKHVIQKPNEAIKDINILSSYEITQITQEFNNTERIYPRGKTIQEQFEEQAKRTPNSVALVCNGKKLTYKELNMKSNSLARTLRNKGISNNYIVGIMLERSLEMIIGILGILKAGGAYLPIDPKYPHDRIQYILDNSEAKLLLMSDKTKSKIIDLDKNLELVNLNEKDVFNSNIENLEVINTPSSAAYIIYTSGTSGKPKGVIIEHHSVGNFIESMTEKISFKIPKPILSTTTISFDIFVFETLLPLIKGWKVIIADDNECKNPRLISDLIKYYDIKLLQTTPSKIKLLISDPTISECITNLEYLLMGGEPFTKDIYKKLKVISSDTRIYNLYGPTETTIWSTMKEITKEESITIGKPIGNTSVLVLDKYGKIVPIGVGGDVYIGGHGLARGYLKREQLTNEKFIESPIDGKRIYKTGDFARWLSNGEIEFLGRNDKQVKLRGYRIELQEIESILLEIDGIKEIAVTIDKDKSDNNCIYAYYVSDKELLNEEIRRKIAKKLPHYMIPSYFIHMRNLPLSPNGKLDEKALPKLENKNRSVSHSFLSTNKVDRKLKTAWKQILQIDRVGKKDDFFELGGDSLKAIALISQLYKDLYVSLSIQDIFELRTIDSISRYIKRAKHKEYSPIEKVKKKSYYQTSSTQKRMYLLNQFETSGKQYNIPGAIEIKGPLKRKLLENVLNNIVMRHESLRSEFHFINGELVQRIKKEVDLEIDYSEIPSDKFDKEVECFIRTFELNKAPLFRVKILKIDNDTHFLLYDIHHIISDGISVGVLLKEIVDLYRGDKLPPLDIQYKDFAAWQQKSLDSKEMKKQENYWLDKMSGEVPVLNLPMDYKRPSEQSFEGATLKFEIEGKLYKKLKKLAFGTGTTIYMVLLAIYNILLSKYTGQEDITVGTPVTGRRQTELKNIIGMFVNTLVMRNIVKTDLPFSIFLKSVKENTIKALVNQDYPFEKLVDKLNIERSLNRNPLFDSMFVMQDNIANKFQVENITFNLHKVETKTSKFDLSLQATEMEGRIELEYEYCTILLKKETIERMATHFTNIVKEIVSRPNKVIADINMLSAYEIKQIKEEFNYSQVTYPREQTIHGRFEEQAKKTPNKTAVVLGKESLTYKELSRKSNQLANVLRKKGVKRNCIVGILADRSIETIIGILGILKAGGAYLPIDRRYPDWRVKYMLVDCKTSILMSTTSLLSLDNKDWQSIIPQNIEIVMMDSYFKDQTIEKEHVVDKVNTATDLAYIMYTSGTTGKPKGCMVQHRNVLRLVINPNYVDLEDDDRILQTGSLSFDASTFEIWTSLLNGLTLYLIDESFLTDIYKLEDTIKKNNISTLWLTSPLFNQIAEYKPEVFSSIKNLLVGGDRLSVEHINKIRNRYTDISIINGYGPTENTTFTTCFKIDGDYQYNVPIGKPINNTKVYITDDNFNLQPIGVPGELYVSGDGVAKGYLNLQSLTEKRFLPNPFENDKLNNRIYRTGDIAKWLPDGNIEFLGRRDKQVKVRGFRIEIAEIEFWMLKHELIDAACVIDKEDKNTGKYLCGYFVSSKNISIIEVKEWIMLHLPEYMVPKFLIPIEEMPLTPNGKIDKSVLISKESKLTATRTEYIPPTTKEERQMVNIWEKVLGIKRIGIKDSFFFLGGHSLKGIQIVEMAKRIGINISVKDIYKFTTVSMILKNTINDAKKNVFSDKDDIKIEREISNVCYNDSSKIHVKDYSEYNSKKLNIKIQQEITTYLYRALPISIVLSYDKLIPWYYSHFIQICSQTFEQGYIMIDYLQPLEHIEEVVYCEYLGYDKLENVDDIIQFVISKINLGYYVVICLDEYYLSDKEDFQKKHFVHESMIYGYSCETKEFYGIGFNRNRIFANITFNFDMFRKAYEMGKEYYNEKAWYAEEKAVTLLRQTQRDDFDFDPQKFLTKLQDYIISRGDEKDVYIVTPPTKKNEPRKNMFSNIKFKYGLDVYDDVINGLEWLLQGRKIIDYRAIHLISEHKKAMMNRFNFLISEYQLTGEIIQFIEEYRVICDSFEKIRMSFFELENSDSIQEKDNLIVLQEIIHVIRLIKNDEKILLKKMYKSLKNSLNEKLENYMKFFL